MFFPFVILPIELATRLHEAHHGSDEDEARRCIEEILEQAFGQNEEGKPPEQRLLHYWERVPGGQRYAVDQGWLYVMRRPGLLGWLTGSLPPIFVEQDKLKDLFGQFPSVLANGLRAMGMPVPSPGESEGPVLSMVRDEETEEEVDPMEILRQKGLSNPVSALRYWVATGLSPDGCPVSPQMLKPHASGALIQVDRAQELLLEILELEGVPEELRERLQEWSTFEDLEQGPSPVVDFPSGA